MYLTTIDDINFKVILDIKHERVTLIPPKYKYDNFLTWYENLFNNFFDMRAGNASKKISSLHVVDTVSAKLFIFIGLPCLFLLCIWGYQEQVKRQIRMYT